MALALTVMLITLFPFSLALNGIVYAAIPLLGICYGIFYDIMVPPASELFGLKHFGLIYMGLGNPTGALLVSGLLAGYAYESYDAEAAKQDSSACVGHDCFEVTFLVLAGVCGLGTILSIILTVRIRPVYQLLYSGGSFRLPQTPGH